jgi:hypothetical protein
VQSGGHVFQPGQQHADRRRRAEGFNQQHSERTLAFASLGGTKVEPVPGRVRQVVAVSEEYNDVRVGRGVGGATGRWGAGELGEFPVADREEHLVFELRGEMFTDFDGFFAGDRIFTQHRDSANLRFPGGDSGTFNHSDRIHVEPFVNLLVPWTDTDCG